MGGGAEKHLKILTKDCNLSFNVVNYNLYNIPKISGEAILELSVKGQKVIVLGACRLRLLTYGQLGNNVVMCTWKARSF